MIYIVSNVKGGSGKSFISGHMIPAYIKRKSKQDYVQLFEFDEYSKTSANYLSNSNFVISKVISEEDIEDEIFNVGFTSRNEDVIVDVGAGYLLKKVLEASFLGFGEKDITFVVPYSDDSSMALLDTIKIIEEYKSNPNLMVVINRLPMKDFSLTSAKKIAIELFGSAKYGVKPNKDLPRIEKYIKAAIPQNHEVVTFSRLEGASLVELKDKYEATINLTDEEKIQFWKDLGLVEGEEISQEEYMRNVGMLQRYLNTSRFLNGCTEFYKALEQLESKKKIK